MPMNENKFYFNLKALNDSYNTSRSFELEKMYDYARYLCKSSTYFDRIKKEYFVFEEKNIEYNNSLLAKCKEFVNKGEYGIINKKLITDNVLNVNFKLTKKRKTIDFSEKKLKDNLVKYLEKYFVLKKYLEIMNGLKSSEIVNSKLTISSKISHRNKKTTVELLAETTENALYIWAGNKSDTHAKELVKNWLSLLSSNLPIQSLECGNCVNSFDEIDNKKLQNFDSKKIDEVAKLNGEMTKFLANKDYFVAYKNNLSL